MSENPQGRQELTPPTSRIPDPVPQTAALGAAAGEQDPAPTRTMTVPEPDNTADAATATESGTAGTVTADTVGAPHRQLRMRTVVIGVVLLAIAVLTNLRLTTSVDFQLGTVVLALMIGCGVLLIVGATRRE